MPAIPNLSAMVRTPAGVLAIATLLAVGLLCAPAQAAPAHGARCSFGSNSHLLRIVVERDPAAERGDRSGFAYVAVRDRFVYLFAGSDGDEVACRGPAPTTRNIETVQVVRGPGVTAAVVYVDQRGGAFAPGNTDERDGSSEVEFDMSLGDDGIAYFLMTPGNDAVYVRDLEPVDYANLNALEPVADTDVVLREGAALFVNGAAGDDALVATPIPPGPYDPAPPLGGFGAGLLGGAGADVLLGTDQDDYIVGGGGPDRLEGAAGDDALIARDRAPDRLDCGAGLRDLAELDRRDALAGCERTRRGPRDRRPLAARLLARGTPDHFSLRLRHR